MDPEVVESIQGLQWSPGITDAHKAALRALLADWERRGEALREISKADGANHCGVLARRALKQCGEGESISPSPCFLHV